MCDVNIFMIYVCRVRCHLSGGGAVRVDAAGALQAGVQVALDKWI